MSSARETTFLKESAVKAFQPRHRKIINYNIDKYDDAVKRALPEFHHLENSTLKAHIIKSRVNIGSTHHRTPGTNAQRLCHRRLVTQHNKLPQTTYSQHYTNTNP